jgi:hypothetical protein
VLWVVVDQPRPTTLSNGKPEGATAVYKLLMMGMRMPKRVELYLNDEQ